MKRIIRMSEAQQIATIIISTGIALIIGIPLGYYCGYKDTIRLAARKKAGRYKVDKYGQSIFVWKIDEGDKP